jgi:hypothetical protein
VGRVCIYDDTLLGVRSEGSSYPPTLVHSHHSLEPVLGHLTANDPYCYVSTGGAAVNMAVYTELLKILAPEPVVKAGQVAEQFFCSLWKRCPIIPQKAFWDRLPGLSPAMPADFTTLCLCMQLILQRPSAQATSMQTSLYINIKRILSLLEATGYQSLESVQCRVIVAFYEMGHAIYPAASISIAAAARLARTAGVYSKVDTQIGRGTALVEAEARRRLWWAVANIDR